MYKYRATGRLWERMSTSMEVIVTTVKEIETSSIQKYVSNAIPLYGVAYLQFLLPCVQPSTPSPPTPEMTTPHFMACFACVWPVRSDGSCPSIATRLPNI